jgi:hypothetical protein
MNLGQEGRISIGARNVGFVVAYFVFTTTIFFFLVYLKRLPAGWTYFQVMAGTLLLSILGYAVERFLR